MSLKLGPNQTCPYSTTCKFNSASGIGGPCHGSRSDRNKEFECSLVSSDGVFSESGFRSGHDETGKMKILMETDQHVNAR